MIEMKRELDALRRRLKWQTAVGIALIVMMAATMGGADAVARALAETDSWLIRTQNAAQSANLERIVVTAGVDVARVKIRNGNIELFGQATASLPAGAAEGAIAYDSTAKRFKFFDGTSWVDPSGSGVTRIIVDKPSDESVASSTTFQADDHLTFAIGASETWEADLWLNVSAGAGTADIKYRFNAPAGATVKFWVIGSDTGTNPTNNVGCFYATGIGGTGVSTGLANVTDGGNMIHVVISNGATAGSVTLEWAQNTSKPAATTMRSGSRLVATKF